MTTEQDCLDALREAARKLDESPTKAQYEDLGLTPSASTILRVVGGWNAAKEKAGLETTYSRGPRVQEKPDDVDLPEDRLRGAIAGSALALQEQGVEHGAVAATARGPQSVGERYPEKTRRL